jgi:hypothetical protein
MCVRAFKAAVPVQGFMPAACFQPFAVSVRRMLYCGHQMIARPATAAERHARKFY